MCLMVAPEGIPVPTSPQLHSCRAKHSVPPCKGGGGSDLLNLGVMHQKRQQFLGGKKPKPAAFCRSSPDLHGRELEWDNTMSQGTRGSPRSRRRSHQGQLRFSTGLPVVLFFSKQYICIQIGSCSSTFILYKGIPKWEENNLY